jgi:hypothetical protein
MTHLQSLSRRYRVTTIIAALLLVGVAEAASA